MASRYTSRRLVNCAGVALPADVIQSPLEEWRKPFDIMFNGAVRMTRLAVGLMPDGGRMIHITSIHGERAEAGASAYAMAKAALNQFCRNLALELGPRGILVNAITPAAVMTAMADQISDERKRAILARIPMARFLEADEVAAQVAWLCSADCSFATGAVFDLSGGRATY